MVLVTGTVVYGKGDDQEVAEQIEAGGEYEAVADSDTATPRAAPGEPPTAASGGLRMRLLLGRARPLPARQTGSPPNPRTTSTHCAGTTGAVAVPSAGDEGASGSQAIPMGASYNSLKSTQNIG